MLLSLCRVKPVGGFLISILQMDGLSLSEAVGCTAMGRATVVEVRVDIQQRVDCPIARVLYRLGVFGACCVSAELVGQPYWSAAELNSNCT